MLRIALTGRRKVALTIALAWLVLSAVMAHRIFRPNLSVPYVPLGVAVGWALTSALATGVAMAELIRMSTRAASMWSSRRHLTVVLLSAAACFVVQCFFWGLAYQVYGSNAS